MERIFGCEVKLMVNEASDLSTMERCKFKAYYFVVDEKEKKEKPVRYCLVVLCNDFLCNRLVVFFLPCLIFLIGMNWYQSIAFIYLNPFWLWKIMSLGHISIVITIHKLRFWMWCYTFFFLDFWKKLNILMLRFLVNV